MWAGRADPAACAGLSMQVPLIAFEAGLGFTVIGWCVWELVSLRRERARDRIKAHFDGLFGPNDPALYKLAMEVLRGEHAWLEQGIVSNVAPPDKTKRRPSVTGATLSFDSAPVKVGATK